jgi:ABC-2 type transport system permease protein
METKIPLSNKIFSSLFKADLVVQWRNRRASLMTLLIPIIILVSWKSVIAKFGGAFALASCITFGLVAVGLMGYTTTTATDREKGIFQRLRVTPATTLEIMSSRLLVQVLQMLFLTIVTFLVGYFWDKIGLTAGGYALTLLVAVICGGVYLGLGQALVGLIASAETLNSVVRLVYFAFIVLGVLGEFGVLGHAFQTVVTWSPYGTVKDVLSAAMLPASWNSHSWLALGVTLVYAVIFAGVGIKYFKWSSN